MQRHTILIISCSSFLACLKVYKFNLGMKHLLRTFLADLGGDPNKRNAFDETVLHSACSAGTTFPPASGRVSVGCVRIAGGEGDRRPETDASAGALTASTQERRAACVALLLQWRGGRLPSSEERERVQLDALDREGNSALHLAAGAGLNSGVRLLLAAGARSLTRDSSGRTAAQRALVAGHARLAAIVERAALFSEEPVDWCAERWAWTSLEVNEEEAEEAALAGGAGGFDSHEGLRPQQLREAKDRLLVDTSDMLRVSLFTAEALLRDNEWCRDALVERWMKDAAGCCQSAGVSLPGGSLDSEHPEEAFSADGERKTIECGICCEEVSALDAGSGGCGHVFCAGCWGRYLKGRVCEGEPRPACPAPRCRRAAPHHLLQRCLTPRTQRKYLLFDIKAFVESSRGMKWCPVAGCGRAVKLHETELAIPPAADDDVLDGEGGTAMGYPTVSRGVDCGDFHFFCWECNGEPHPPIGCAAWARWTARAGATPPAPLASAAGGAESAASSLWLLAHCKPCPSCSCPIQKNDGCNHMKCTKCKFDFCWVCLESWKRHGSATGGYFRCTREEATARAEQSRGTALAEARIQNVEAQEQWRFAVQCARYRRHEQRWIAERPLLIATPAKAKALDHNNASNGILENAARELGLSRRVLIGCCTYSYALSPNAPHRPSFHYAQDELERCVSRLSNLIACEVIEAPLLALKRATAATKRWRLAVMRLVRPPAPPAAISAQELRMMARLLARGRLDPRDPWRFPLGPRGEPLRAPDPLDPDRVAEPQPSVSPRVVPERSTPVNDGDVYRINVSEYNMDLIIALEMSRLQMLEEQARRGHESDGSSTSQDTTLTRNRQRPARLNISVSIGASSDNEDKNLSDDQLKLAIQLSLQETGARFRTDSDDKFAGEGSSGCAGQYRELSTLQSIEGPSWSITKERREASHEDLLESNTSSLNRNANRDESWSRAADITVGYFLKALGRSPLDLPNLALGLDILGAKQDKISFPKQSDGENPSISGFINYCNEGLKTRPPLLRSGVAGQRPPLLRQIGGKSRRSWSMGDISIRSSSTDDTTTGTKIIDEPIIIDDDENVFEYTDKRLEESQNFRRRDSPRCSKSSIRSGGNSGCVQIDTESQKDPRKKIHNFPKNLPRGEFCCEKKCVKNKSAGPSTPRYYDKKVVPDADAPKTVSVDWRGKVDPEAFDFTEKTIRLPDLNSSHLRVNRSSRDELTTDSFRRHSDHIPRAGDRTGGTVKACSSERHIGERSPPRLRIDSPKKSKISDAAPTLSIKICDEAVGDEGGTKTKRGLETDSSNECESETGIPKSPTLYISGVSICREPGEQRSPKARQKVVRGCGSGAMPSSPVVVRVTSPSLSPASPEPYTPSLLRSATPTSPARERRRAGRFSDDTLDAPVLPPSHFSDDVFYDEDDPGLVIDCALDEPPVYAGCHGGGIFISSAPAPERSNLDEREKVETSYESPPASPFARPVRKTRSARPLLGSREFGDEARPRDRSELKSRSANEPERDREMFQFPKSSTDGALSSVLHVQESNLSSDDFHEALFLLERSPKTRDSKRRKRSKKREKESAKKEDSPRNDSRLAERDEASSAL